MRTAAVDGGFYRVSMRWAILVVILLAALADNLAYFATAQLGQPPQSLSAVPSAVPPPSVPAPAAQAIAPQQPQVVQPLQPSPAITNAKPNNPAAAEQSPSLNAQQPQNKNANQAANLPTVNAVAPPGGNSSPSNQKNQPGGNKEESPANGDPCANGLCDVPGKGRCLSLSNTATCQAFSGMYLPSDISAFLKARFPNKVFEKSEKLGKAGGGVPLLSSPRDFDSVFEGNNEFGFFKNYTNSYNIGIFGCTAPNQRYLYTYICMDMLDFYARLKDPCSAGDLPRVCRSTLEARAASLKADIENPQFCLIPNSALNRGIEHVAALRTSYLGSEDANCISGEANELASVTGIASSARRSPCGFVSDVAACRAPKSECPTMPQSLRAMCPRILADAETLAPSSLTDAFDSSTVAPRIVALVFFGILCGILASALYAMSRLRKISTKKMARPDTVLKPDDRATIIVCERPQSAAEKEAARKKVTSFVSFRTSGFIEQSVPVPAQNQAPIGDTPTATKTGVIGVQRENSGHSNATSNSSFSSVKVVASQSPPQPQTAHVAAPMPTLMSPATVRAIPSEPQLLISPQQEAGQAAEETYMIAIIDFKATEKDELSFSAGERVRILEAFKDGWVLAQLTSTGAQGFAPKMALKNMLNA